MTRDTVWCDTPARLATSNMDAFFLINERDSLRNSIITSSHGPPKKREKILLFQVKIGKIVSVNILEAYDG